MFNRMFDELKEVKYFKGALSGLRQFLATESSLKVIQNAFYFISKALFVLRILNEILANMCILIVC